jgi:Rieske Fe-S protein
VSSSTADSPQPPAPLRRRLLDWFLGGSAAALLASIAYPIARFVSPPRVPEATTNQVEAGALNDPDLVSQGYKIIRFGSEPVILLKLSDTDVRAFSATCTHLACIVEFRKQKHDIYCNCHGGEYDLRGRNVAGPPPRPLIPFKVDLVAKSGGATSIVVSRA